MWWSGLNREVVSLQGGLISWNRGHGGVALIEKWSGIGAVGTWWSGLNRDYRVI